MTKPAGTRTTLHDLLADVERVTATLEELVPELRHNEGRTTPPRRQLAHEAVAQAEISLHQLRDVAARLDAAKSLVRSADAPVWV